MFIKKAVKIDHKSNKKYTAYHLVESVRTKNGPRQRTILYLGADIDLSEGDLKLLAERIEGMISGESPLIPYPENIERLAQHYASQIFQRLAERKEDERQEVSGETKFVSIDINSIENSQPRSVGAEHLMLQMANQLNLPKKLQEIGLSKTDQAIALASIIARAVHPDSERSTYAWLCHKSGLAELLDFNFNSSSLNKLYQISDKLLSYKDELEQHLEVHERTLHGYQSTIALYDLANTYMEGQAPANPKALHGFSKEKRTDCPLITMGLVMNEHGFLNRTSFLPGNASEPKTLREMIENLNPNPGLYKPIIILDAGIATKDNLAWLRKQKYGYIVSSRQDAPEIELEEEMVSVGDRHGLVKAALVKSDGGDEERWLYCESEAKEAVASKMKQLFRQRFEEEIKKASESLMKKKGRKKLEKVIEKIGRLKEKHKRISGCYDIRIIASDDNKTAVKIEWEIIEEKMSEKLKGSYFLRTNLIGKNAKELWNLYNTLRRIEDAFRFMKSSLGLRPVFHQKELRVDGHLWITVMAYHLIQNCLYQLSKAGIKYQWKTVREIMINRNRTTVQAKTAEGNILHYRSTTKAEVDQKKIYKALGLSSQILKAHKVVV